jgi:hypothetical protein
MKTFFLPGLMPDKHRKIAVDKEQRDAAVVVVSSLILLHVTERDVLTLQMEQTGNKNALL